jgi:alkyl hydroperoxide reductase subunit AhpC
LKKLEKKCHGKNIVFISISVDNKKNHDKWKQMIKDENMGGIQLFADKGITSDIMKAYNIKGVPHFVLINPAGNIISTNAPRPSFEKEIIKLFKNNGI